MSKNTYFENEYPLLKFPIISSKHFRQQSFNSQPSINSSNSRQPSFNYSSRQPSFNSRQPSVNSRQPSVVSSRQHSFNSRQPSGVNSRQPSFNSLGGGGGVGGGANQQLSVGSFGAAARLSPNTRRQSSFISKQNSLESDALCEVGYLFQNELCEDFVDLIRFVMCALASRDCLPFC